MLINPNNLTQITLTSQISIIKIPPHQTPTLSHHHRNPQKPPPTIQSYKKPHKPPTYPILQLHQQINLLPFSITNPIIHRLNRILIQIKSITSIKNTR